MILHFLPFYFLGKLVFIKPTLFSTPQSTSSRAFYHLQFPNTSQTPINSLTSLTASNVTMHSLLALSTFSALLSTAQALVVHPLPRAVTHTTTSHHGCVGPTPLAPFETNAAGRTIRTYTFACATSINPTPTGPADHGSSGALHNSDAEGHHGAVKRAGGSDSNFAKRESGVGEPDATRTLRKRCWASWMGDWTEDTALCAEGLHTGTLTSDVPSATAKPKRRDLLKVSRDALPTDLPTANH